MELRVVYGSCQFVLLHVHWVDRQYDGTLVY
jgi:hypothetical protein